jgi:hypothetical protein
LSNKSEQKEDSNLGKYRAHLILNYASTVVAYEYYLLMEDNLLVITFDFDPRCISGTEELPEYLSYCTNYFQIYLPIVEKALSTLEIPDYVDDRGYATSTEIQLLPDELRVYEVR